jgi:hypothetical protein
MTTQRCPFCEKKVSYDSTAKPKDELVCADGHASVLTRCPSGICPTRLIAVDPKIGVGAILKHGLCMSRLQVIKAGPPAPELRSKS